MSILVFLLSNIFLNDTFYFDNRSYLSNYADDNVLCTFRSSLEEVKQTFSQDLQKLSEWFHENFMTLNPEKCDYMCLGKDYASDLLRFYGEVLETRKLETVSLYSKASQKLGVLQRFSNLLDAPKKNLLFNSVIKFQFSYCPLA